ncbi:MAG: response regulator [Syntrophobacterales bacterium]|jgi:two-component system chemotaxis sensor kinase CheA|nr:response regulator [Syntrophobacterales bacterium]
MGTKDQDFLKRLQATFKVEAAEHLKAIAAGLLELERADAPEARQEIIQAVFREAHSLKGAARAVNLVEIEAVCQALENVLARWKGQDQAAAAAGFDVLHQAVVLIERRVSAESAGATPAEQAQLNEIAGRLGRVARAAAAPAAEGDAPVPAAPESSPALPDREPRPAAAESVRVSLAKLQELLRQSEDFLAAKLGAGHLLTAINDIGATLGAWREKWDRVQPAVQAQRRSGERAGPAPQADRLSEFLQWDEAYHKSLESQLAGLAQTAARSHRLLSRMVETLTGDLKQVLMLPCQPALDILPRLMRDLSRSQGKDAELIIQGGELEIDRRILDEIKDPLIHLVRNCIDHGIETPEERRRQHKPVRGRIVIAIRPTAGGKVEMRVSDDGAGIDATQLRHTTARLGVISPAAAENAEDSELLPLIFEPGVSTSPIITDISGRGLGLAILREKIEKLGGSYSVASQPGQGTTFHLVLPITLATFRGTLVRLGSRVLVVPTKNVEQVRRVPRSEVRTVENRETIELNGQAVSLVSLARVLELPEAPPAGDPEGLLPVVVLTLADKRLAFRVDEILNEQEVLEKPLGRQLARVRNLSGATILGTGELAPILNAADVMKSATRSGPAVLKPVPEEFEDLSGQTILVAEDSITARTLLKNILEAAGYRVVTAVDGIDAFGKLAEGDVALVVSDVDMPRLGGFDLTAKLRGDPRFEELPVVLVTALESPEDRQRGIDAGANAYIVKSSFDQSNLLETIKRLI